MLRFVAPARAFVGQCHNLRADSANGLLRACSQPCKVFPATRSLDQNQQPVYEKHYKDVPVLLFSHGALQHIQQQLVFHTADTQNEGENHKLCSHVLPQPS